MNKNKELDISSQEVFAVSLDAGAIIIDFNETASKISGYHRNEIIGKNWFEIFIPESNIIEMLEVFGDLFKGKDSHWQYTNTITCKDGSIKKLNWINNIITNNRQKPTLIYSLGTEV